MFDDEKGVYTIGVVAQSLQEHPETLRVWEKNGLISPQREGCQRRYSNSDLLRLAFIKYLMDEKGLNIAGVRQVIGMYPCWKQAGCPGGGAKNANVPVDESKPCWREKHTFCRGFNLQSAVCVGCSIYNKCKSCKGCP